MNHYYLGIDTSCYTTSCAIVDQEGNLIGEARRLLQVKSGACGLQQSEMVFQHTRVLPDLIESLTLDGPISAIGVSAFPRREDNSYMPAFLVGLGHARTLAHILKTPLYRFSHQENHILAALRQIKSIPIEPFYSLHVSGGTTELLYCQYDTSGCFHTELVGGSLDLHGGQFVDRVGVALGFHFPAGPMMEKAANKAFTYDPLPSSVKNGYISFSGSYSEMMRRIQRCKMPNEMALSVFKCIAKSLDKMISYHVQQRPALTLVAVGGVMSNQFLRHQLERTTGKLHMKLVLADAKYSCDNATGNAFGASLLHQACGG